jgi:ribonuclease HI
VPNRKVTIYTDGSCRPNPGVGGWGAIIMLGGYDYANTALFGGEAETTSSRMELVAAAEALAHLTTSSAVQLYTDSQYLRNGMVKKWAAGWSRRGWRTNAGSPVKNQDVWMRLLELDALHDVEWIWVKGHKGNLYNEVADRLANTGRLRG